MQITAGAIWNDIQKIRKNAPLIHNITNYVVMNNTANALLAIGASPVMAHAVEEVEDMTKIAGALVINIGTLSSHWVTAMEKSIKQASDRGIPIVLDPVGVGATGFRTKTVHSLLSISPPSIIRGNASEIMACVTEEAKTKGVDSTNSSVDALNAATQLSSIYGSTVVVSGETDYIVSTEKIVKIKNGHPTMPRITGMGCTATAICGAFASVNKDFSTAAANAMAVMGISGEIAAEKSNGPGSLQINFYDALYNLTELDISKRLKAE